MRPVLCCLYGICDSFKAIIWVRESEFFTDGVLDQVKLRNHLSANFNVTFPIGGKRPEDLR